MDDSVSDKTLTARLERPEESVAPIVYACGFGFVPTYHFYADGRIEIIPALEPDKRD